MKFSPRARGCSLVEFALSPPGNVFPACAGMFPMAQPIVGVGAGFPRVRGDVPRAGFLSL